MTANLLVSNPAIDCDLTKRLASFQAQALRLRQRLFLSAFLLRRVVCSVAGKRRFYLKLTSVIS